MNAFWLMGYSGVHGLIPEAHLTPRISELVSRAILKVVPALTREIVCAGDRSELKCLATSS
jgi:hypothetical protein